MSSVAVGVNHYVSMLENASCKFLKSVMSSFPGIMKCFYDAIHLSQQPLLHSLL